VHTGIFVDSAVAGIGYRTSPGEHEGVTGSEGEYEYEEGDTVTFFIGDLELPPTAARGIVTPLNIAGTDDVNDPVAVNIARLLQSLDADGDPSNGITIHPDAADAATPVNFSQPVADFAASAAVTNLMSALGVTLVSEAAATAHLQASMDEQRRSLIGSWYFRDDSDSDPDRQYHIVLTFLDETNFVIANDESEPDDENGQDGFERGTYSWNLRTGVFEATVPVLTDNNGEWGFSHPCGDEVFTLEIRGNELLLGAEGEVGESCAEAGGEDTRIAFQRVQEDVLVVVSFMEGNRYMMLQDSPADEAGEPGIERGTYVYNGGTNQILFTTITDTNGQWGFSHPCAILEVEGSNNLACGPEGQDIVETITVENDTLTFISEADTIVNGEPDPAIFSRVRPIVVD
jgi:hypothetical protein